MQNNSWPWPRSESAWPFPTLTNTCLQNTAEYILPCPFCGSDDVAHVIVPQYEKPGLPSDTWVQCNGCGVEVHTHHIAKQFHGNALDLWNQRS